MSGARHTGRVRFFDDSRGFGFLIPDDDGPEVFVHRSDLARSLIILLADQRVSYELVDTRKGTGKKAANVEII